MKKLIPLLFLFLACTKSEYDWPKDVISNTTTADLKYSLSIDSVLDIYGTKSLPKDNNGYYHMKLYSNTNQTFSRVVGKILVNGNPPLQPKQYIDWENNLNWYILPGDTILNITKSYINYFTGEFTIVQLPAIIANTASLVRTTNKSSINSDNGTISNMIAPIYKMKGDTMILKASHTESKLVVYTKIILE